MIPGGVYLFATGTPYDANGNTLTAIPDKFPAREALHNAGFVCIEQLEYLGRAVFEGIDGVGAKTADAIEKAITKLRSPDSPSKAAAAEE